MEMKPAKVHYHDGQPCVCDYPEGQPLQESAVGPYYYRMPYLVKKAEVDAK